MTTTTSWAQVTILLTLWIGIFCNYAVYSVIAPFFPKVARSKGISEAKFSIVFAAYSFAQILASYTSGRFITIIGPKTVVITGLTVTGLATMIFGFVEGIQDADIFILVCISIRLLEGAGFSAFFTAALTIVVEIFPSDPGYYVGLTESIVTIGMIMGPPIGAFLYDIGGFPLPLTTFGAALSASAMLSTLTVPSVKSCKSHSNNPISHQEYLHVLSLKETMISVACTALNVATDVFILINLGEHVKKFDLTTVQEGFTYLCLFLSYGISSPLSGRIGDRSGRELLLQFLGCLCIMTSFMMIAPVVLPVPSSVALVVLGLLVKGVGAGPLIACSYTSCLKATLDTGRIDASKAYAMTSTIVSFSIPLGNFFGGLTAPIMYSEFGMVTSSSLFMIVFGLLAFVCLIADRKNAVKRRFKYQRLHNCEL